MATHGSMKAFNAQVDDWSIYVERLQHYFIANDVTDAGKKRSILLTVCGTPTYTSCYAVWSRTATLTLLRTTIW